MRIPLTDLRRGLNRRREFVGRTRAEGLTVGDTTVRPEVDVVLDVVLESVHEGVMVTGTVTGSWRGPCNLCLEPLEGPIVAEVAELFADEPVEGETYALGREFLDTTEMIRDALLLALPVLARCPYGGIGRCPNAPAISTQGERAASAAPPTPDPRWAALDQLRFPEPGSSSPEAG